MTNEINPIFSNIEELKKWLLNVQEKYYVELKKAQGYSSGPTEKVNI